MSYKLNLKSVANCPLCESDNIDIHADDPFDGYQGNLTHYVIQCKECGCNIRRSNKEEALSVWNNRNGKTIKFQLFDSTQTVFPNAIVKAVAESINPNELLERISRKRRR